MKEKIRENEKERWEKRGENKENIVAKWRVNEVEIRGIQGDFGEIDNMAKKIREE